MAAPTSVSTGRCGDPICAVSGRVCKYEHVAINKENSTESICDEFYEKNEETEQRKRYESTSCLRPTL